MEVTAKWRTIKDNFFRSQRKQAEAKNSSSVRRRVAPYIYEDQLYFLRKSKEMCQTEDSLRNIDNEGEGSQRNDASTSNTELSNINFLSTSSSDLPDTLPRNEIANILATNQGEQTVDAIQNAQTPSRKRAKIDIENALINFMDSRTRKNNERDEDLAFFMSLLPTVQKLDTDDKLEFRIEVMRLLQKYRDRSKKN